MAYVMILALLRPSMAPKLPPEERNVPPHGDGRAADLLRAARGADRGCVLGAILFGLATPSEAAAMGALGRGPAGRRLPGAHLRQAEGACS
jgi:TRAP-type mannitol/chloroaromatic compound transport system permease large subunit